jgi:hypothetical protein
MTGGWSVPRLPYLPFGTGGWRERGTRARTSSRLARAPQRLPHVLEKFCAAPEKSAVETRPSAGCVSLETAAGSFDGGWVCKAAAFGWGPLDLFGCDRERPFARIDHLGLLWLLDGGTIAERGTRQCYRRRPAEVGRVVLAWETR